MKKALTIVLVAVIMAAMIIAIYTLKKKLDVMEVHTRVPVGTITAFYGETAPEGWMLCDGSTIPNDGRFENLIDMIGPEVPDLRGVFLRGVNYKRHDEFADSEPGRGLGSFQTDSIKNHTHPLEVPNRLNGSISGTNPQMDWAQPRGSRIITTRDNNGGAAETRPKNIAVNFIIKT